MLMKNSFLLPTPQARQLYERVRHLPIIDFHNHLNAEDIVTDRRYGDIVSLWLAPDPYKHRLMRICGVPEERITGSAEPYDKFLAFCEVFPYLAGNPVYDWSRMELSSVVGIEEELCVQNARKLYDRANEMLASPEYSCRGILSRFGIEYQSPVASLTEDLSFFDGATLAPSLRADDLLSPSDEQKRELSQKSGVLITDENTYLDAVCVMLDRFKKKGCRFADHSLDADFFREEERASREEMLVRLACEYEKRGFTLLLHMNAVRQTSPRLRALAGAAGGFASAAESFPLSRIAALLGEMERRCALPDTVLFPLNMSDVAPASILQGSFSEDGVPSKVQLGPAWWWCDHALGIEHTLKCISSFGVLSQFIGMTTDSRSVLSFVRHDYFRRLLCACIDGQSKAGEWHLPLDTLAEIAEGIAYKNAKRKIDNRHI